MEKGKPIFGSSSSLSNEALGLFENYRKAEGEKSHALVESNIKVSQVLGSVAFLYERIRNALDYKGEHLVRRNAIERILRRQIWERRNKNADLITDELIRELIWARYVKNDSIPKRNSKLIEGIVEKYLSLFDSLPRNEKKR